MLEIYIEYGPRIASLPIFQFSIASIVYLLARNSSNESYLVVNDKTPPFCHKNYFAASKEIYEDERLPKIAVYFPERQRIQK